MNPDRQPALQYLRAPQNGLWHWEEDGAVLAWHDGTTLAFREEVVRILEWLAPHDLPSFGAVVLLLAACRGKLPRAAELIPEAGQQSLPFEPSIAHLSPGRLQLIAQVEADLAELARVPALIKELTSGVTARCLLAEAVFEAVQGERYVDARAVRRGLHAPMSDAELVDSELEATLGSQIRQLHLIARGLEPHTAESLALRLRTGLDALPKPAEVELPTAERARRLIEELSRDHELGSVARAARELIAAVRLPRHLGEREELAVGGIADITNRGPLDRLLLSELAHDDLTLAVRVAMNEALYFRREPPRGELPGTLALLLDSGLRLWGVPRVLAAALALALVAREKHHATLLAWRAQARTLQPVDLLTRTGLVQHLGALETRAHPGEALPAFAAAVSAHVPHQSVLITHPDALADPELRSVLAAHATAPGFVATVNREGQFALHALPLSRRPPLCEATLDLRTVFDERPEQPPLNDTDPEWPAIFRMSPFPFLLPIAGREELWIQAPDGFNYAVLEDFRLVQFRGRRQGGRVLASPLPAGKSLWMDWVAGTVHVVKAGEGHRPVRLLSLTLPHSPLRVADLTLGEDWLHVHRCGEVILALRHSDVRAYALSDGRLLGRAVNPCRWVHGRYLRGKTHFYCATWDGSNVKLDPVTLPLTCSPANVALIFDRPGVAGPWVLTTDAEVISSATGERIRVAMPSGFEPEAYAATVSPDGRMLHIEMVAPRFAGLLHLETGHRSHDQTVRDKQVVSPPPASLPDYPLYREIEFIAPLANGLAFCGQPGRWWKIALNDDGVIHMSGQLSGAQAPPRHLAFTGQVQHAPPGCSLRVAEWPNHSRIFLDSRGLLHLKSHDPTVPEISFVLAIGELAGWTSDGCVCGPEFFFAGPPHSKPREVFERVKQFLARL